MHFIQQVPRQGSWGQDHKTRVNPGKISDSLQLRIFHSGHQNFYSTPSKTSSNAVRSTATLLRSRAKESCTFCEKPVFIMERMNVTGHLVILMIFIRFKYTFIDPQKSCWLGCSSCTELVLNAAVVVPNSAWWTFMKQRRVNFVAICVQMKKKITKKLLQKISKLFRLG